MRPLPALRGASAGGFSHPCFASSNFHVLPNHNALWKQARCGCCRKVHGPVVETSAALLLPGVFSANCTGLRFPFWVVALGHAEPEVALTGQGWLQDYSYIAEMPQLWEVMPIPTATQGRGAGVLTAPGEPSLQLAGHGPTVEYLVLHFLWSLHNSKI